MSRNLPSFPSAHQQGNMRRAAPFQNDPRMRGGHGPPPPHLPSRSFVPENGRFCFLINLSLKGLLP